jgi:hypothetical protein
MQTIPIFYENPENIMPSGVIFWLRKKDLNLRPTGYGVKNHSKQIFMLIFPRLNIIIKATSLSPIQGELNHEMGFIRCIGKVLWPALLTMTVWSWIKVHIIGDALSGA